MPKQKSTHVDDPAAVGVRLRAARERAGYSQRDLAFHGCSAAYISRIEAGARIPSLQLLRELGRRLGVSADYLATGDELTPAELRERTFVDAEVALRLADREHARELYGDALAAAGGDRERGRALAGLGQLAYEGGDRREAVVLLEEALALLAEAATAYPGAADTLGRAYADLGQLDEAIAIFERYGGAAEQRGDVVERVRFSVLLANALIDSGSFARADEVLGSTLALVRDWGDPIARARTYWSQSRLHTMQGNAADAARYARKALEILELTEHIEYTARAHQLLAYVELDRGHPEEALALLQRSRELVPAGNPIDRARFTLEEARALVQLGRTEEAAALAMETAGLLAGGDPLEAGRGYCVLAGICTELGEPDRAIELYELAIELLEGKPSRYLVDAYRGLADLLEAAGRNDDALEVLKKAVRAQTEAGRPLR